MEKLYNEELQLLNKEMLKKQMEMEKKFKDNKDKLINEYNEEQEKKKTSFNNSVPVKAKYSAKVLNYQKIMDTFVKTKLLFIIN